MKYNQQIDIECDLAALPAMRVFIRQFCENLSHPKLTDEKIHQIELAAHELVANIIQHADLNPSKDKIKISATSNHLSEEHPTLEILFLDHGKAFNPKDAPDPQFDENSVGGFGLYIIEQFIDEVIYQRVNGQNLTYIKVHL